MNQRRLGLGVSAILALSACNAIVGVEDVQGTGPTGSSSSSGDVGGMGGNAGAGGMAGVGGMGGCSDMNPCAQPDISTCLVSFCNPNGVCEERNAGTGTACDNGTCDGNGICVRITGAPCTDGTGCDSGNCVDDVCCATQCEGLCQTCNSPAGDPGTCVTVPPGTADSGGSFPTCAEPMVCDASSKCVLGLGSPCGKSEQCFGGQCVEGVCCQSACTDTCYACNIPGQLGICVAVPAGFDDYGPTSCVGSTVSCDGGGLCLNEIGSQCMLDNQCASGMCNINVCTGNSCEGLTTTCSKDVPESCCASKDVLGGDFDLNNSPAQRADVGDFTLDRFEVTVGRFRQFVEAYGNAGTIPQNGNGAHPRIPNSGWDTNWNASLPTTKDDFKTKLSDCDGSANSTWTDPAAMTETLPINCVNWYEAFAFCIWDGGRLPTEAEWNYAAAGGNQQSEYPWGSTAPTIAHAAFDCTADGSGPGVCSPNDIVRVGLKMPTGNGRWGHADLAGNVAEFTLDLWKPTQSTPCINCASLGNGEHAVRGGNWTSIANQITTTARVSTNSQIPRIPTIGFRCARDNHPDCGNGVVDSGEICDDNAFDPTQKVGCKRCDRIKKVVAGDTHACVVTQKGRLKCWGDNLYGQLGQGTKTGINHPAQWPYIDIDPVQDVAVSLNRTCVLTQKNQVKCFGADSLLSPNLTGLLGTGITGQTSVGDDAGEMQQIQPLPFGIDAVQIVSGRGHSCALLGNNTVRCWGSNVSGRLGIGSTSPPAGGIGGSVFNVDVMGLAASYDSTCALLGGNSVACWGDNRLPLNLTGALGINTTEMARGDMAGEMTMPINVVFPTGPMPAILNVNAITSSGHHYCIGALDGTGMPSTFCWGLNDRGQLGHGDALHWGDGTGGRDMLTLPPTPLGTEILEISAGRSHSCALYKNGDIKCWGSNFSGELCLGTKNDNNNIYNVGDQPNEVANIVAIPTRNPKAIQISAGDQFTCALFEDGRVKCWGKNDKGQLGVAPGGNADNLCDQSGESLDTISFIDPL